jgi:putative ABC transport system permease protein
METLLQDLRYAVRLLQRRPGFTIVAVLTLALGIGANSAIFSIVNAVMLRPLPFKEPERLATLWERNPKEGYEQNPPAVPNFVDWRSRNKSFEQIAIYTFDRKFNLTSGDQPERIEGAQVSPNIFELLGVSPISGRVFSAEEEQPGREQVVILSHNLWKRRFASDPAAIGKTVEIDGRSHSIVGIMPPGFQFPGGTGVILNLFSHPAAELWVPLSISPESLNQRSAHSHQVIGRIKSSVTLEQAEAEMTSIQQQIAKDYPGEFVGTSIKLTLLYDQVVGSVRLPLFVLLGAVAFVLLIACANVANLLLASATARQKEIAIRITLGAGRARVVRQLLTESILLALLGGIIGILITFWGIDALLSILPDNTPRANEISIDRWVLGFTFFISILTGVFFGSVPALQVSRTNLNEGLKEGGRTATDGLHRNRTRSLLVVSEVAFSLVLLIGAALMLQSFNRLLQVKPGFNPENVLTMQLSLPRAKYNRVKRATFFQQAIEGIKTLPGVVSAAAVTIPPMSGSNDNYAFQIENRPPVFNGKSTSTEFRPISPEYFKAIEIPLLKGRSFNEQDEKSSTNVLMINESFARIYFAGEDPIGKRMTLGVNNFTGEIIGVVGDVKGFGLDANVREEVYGLYSQAPFWPDMTLVVKTASNPMSLAAGIRGRIQELDREQPISNIRTMEQIISESVSQPRFRSLLLGIFGLVALVLAIVGIYGVISYSVSQRTHEIGIRMALGAQRGDILKLIVGHGMGLVLAGVVIGLLIAFALTRVMSSLLYGVSATDLTTFISIPILLAAVAFFAGYIPARRATRVDPMVALRYE